MAGLGLEIGNDLRDLGDSPAEEADEAEAEGYLAAEITHTVLEVLFHPFHTILLHHRASRPLIGASH